LEASHVGVSPRASDLEAAEFVYQDDVEHTRNRIGAHRISGSAILQNFDAGPINRERNQVDVPQPTPFAFGATRFSHPPKTKVSLGQKAAKVGMTLPSPPLAMFWFDRSARLNRQLLSNRFGS